MSPAAATTSRRATCACGEGDSLVCLSPAGGNIAGAVDSDLSELDHTVIVTVLPIRVMEVALHNIVDMITVRNGFVAAIQAMPVTAIVAAALVIGCTASGLLVLMVVTFVNEMIVRNKPSLGVSPPVCKRNSTTRPRISPFYSPKAAARLPPLQR